MELADLKTLVAVVENGTISGAAKALNRVPSGITTRILQLEESLGVRLFLREKNRLRVTPQGKELCDAAKQIMGLIADAERRLKATEPGGCFRVGAMESTAAARLAEPLARLHNRYAGLRLELTTGTSRFLHEALLDNRLDAVFIADPPADARVEYTPVYEETLVFVTASGHAPVTDPGSIRQETILAFTEGCSYRSRLMRWFSTFGLAPERIAELSSYHAIMGGAAAGMGVGIVPASVAGLFFQKNLVSVHAFAHPLAQTQTVLAWRKGMHSANISALLGHIPGGRGTKSLSF